MFAFKTKPIILDDIPDHKGFKASFLASDGRTESATLATLKQAQIWIMQRKRHATQDIAKFRIYGFGGRRHIAALQARNSYTIRNLETGKFCAYRWQLTTADLA